MVTLVPSSPETVGKSENDNTLVVIHIEKRDVIRIMSVRKETKKEQKFHEEN